MSTTRTKVVIPDGLCEEGVSAAKIIKVLVEKHDLSGQAPYRDFYTPAEWRERGEEYGSESLLVIMHDGGDIGDFVSYDREQYAMIEELNEALAAVGLYAQQCTTWYSAIYRIQPILS